MRYIPARNHGLASNFPIKRIVMHGTVSPCVPGGALAIAKMFAKTSRDASTQYVVDPSEVVRCVPDNVVAYGAPPNPGSIHVEQCDPQKGSTARWSDAAHLSMLHRSASLVASLCLKYGIPIVKLSAADLKAGRRGICGHADISAAWHQTDHTDPGVGYPWGLFLALVKQYAHPAPIPRPKKVLKMQWLAKTAGAGMTAIFLCDGQTRKHLVDERQLLSIKERLGHFGLSAAISEYAPGELASGIAGVLVGPDAPEGTY